MDFIEDIIIGSALFGGSDSSSSRTISHQHIKESYKPDYLSVYTMDDARKARDSFNYIITANLIHMDGEDKVIVDQTVSSSHD